MNLIRVSAIVALLFGGQALGQSTMMFTLGLGGDNHVALWEELADTRFTAPDPNVLTYGSGEVVPWSVEVMVLGDHSLGWTPNGVSNLVFHLEVIDLATGQLAAVGATALTPGPPADPASHIPAEDGFFSSTNDGDGDGFRGDIGLPDPRYNAAFARSFGDIGPGRIWDENLNGGPYLDRKEYPSAAGFPAGTTAPQGMLVGMGAGYSQYTLSGQVRLPGVGGIGTCALPIVTVAEGQMKLPDGCYVLKLCAGTGNNVLRGDFNCASEAPGSFAVAVDAAEDDYIEFSVGDVGTCPVVDPDDPILDCGVVPRCTLVSAASRRTHDATIYDIDIPIDGTPGVEPRMADAGDPQVVLTYNEANCPDPTCSGVSVVNGSCLGTSVEGNDLVIDVSYSTNACVEVTVGADTVKILAHQGNVSGDDKVNVIDLQGVKNQLFETVDASNAMYDINADNTLDVRDLQVTKNNVFVWDALCD